MANKTETRILKFKAELEAGREFQSVVNKIRAELGDGIDEGLDNLLKNYSTRMKALSKTVDSMDGDPTLSSTKKLHTELNAIAKLTKQIAKNYTEIYGGANSAEINAQSQKVAENRKLMKNAKSNQKNWQRKLEGASGLSNTEVNRAFKSVSKTGITVKGKQYGGEGGAGASEFVEDFQKDAQAFLDAAPELKRAVNERIAAIKSQIFYYGDELERLSKIDKDLQQGLDELSKPGTPNELAVEAHTKSNQILNASGETVTAIVDEQETEKDTKTTTEATKGFNEEVKKTPNLVQKAATQVFTYGTVLTLFRTLVNRAKDTIVNLDKSLTDMAIVTSLTREEAWQMVGTFQALAKETGTTTAEVSSTVTKFLQQGKSMTQALQLSEAALKAASIAGIDSARSVDLLTNAMNGFQMSASQAMEVSDKFAALAAASATDYEELAVALSKVAAQANLAGMSMDFTLGMLAKGIEVTREAPETIGTALKTVISRMRELTDYGETLEEGTDVNRVEKALGNVGVKLRDTNGQFRDLEAVLTELGGKWDTLNVNQQANVAVALAGTRFNETMARAWAA